MVRQFWFEHFREPLFWPAKGTYPVSHDLSAWDVLVRLLPGNCSRAGIDPYNKLVDRISDDNTMDMTKPSDTIPHQPRTLRLL